MSDHHSQPSADPPRTGRALLGVERRESVVRALRSVADAHDLATDVGRGVWEFAVPLERLVASGTSESELRWLACRRLIQSAQDTSTYLETGRSLQEHESLRFDHHTCFVITAAGMELLMDMDEQPPLAPSLTRTPVQLNDVVDEAIVVPNWDPYLRQLSFAGKLVKQFRVPAENQEVILGTFADDGWVRRIDDPLPHLPGHDPKRRLQSAIMCLNRNQMTRAIRFRGDGSAQGIIWEPVAGRSA
ncbi:MAG: hypothetical protein ACE37K_03815 [Planctomycetota bacterium]